MRADRDSTLPDRSHPEALMPNLQVAHDTRLKRPDQEAFGTKPITNRKNFLSPSFSRISNALLGSYPVQVYAISTLHLFGLELLLLAGKVRRSLKTALICSIDGHPSLLAASVLSQ